MFTNILFCFLLAGWRLSNVGQLAAIDHNYHQHLSPKLNKDGSVRHHRKWSRRSKQWLVIEVREDKPYEYMR